MRKVGVVDYNESWREMYISERKLLKRSLGSVVFEVYHIGSTSVPGMYAKPIIDIILEVFSLKELDSKKEIMSNLGYIAKGEFGICGRRYYEKGYPDHTHHLHAFEKGSQEIIRHTKFREYLIQNPEIAKEYGRLKKEIAGSCENDINVYCNSKNEFIKHHEQLATKIV